MASGQLIAQGRTAEIYAWAPGRVLKLFRPGYRAAAAEHEAAVTRQAPVAAARLIERVPGARVRLLAHIRR